MTSGATAAAGIPPQGVVPNFVTPPSLYPQILATVILCTALTTLFTFARVWTQWARSAWALEDHLLTLAWAFNLVYIYLFLEQGKLGTGRHIWDVRAVDTVKLTKYQWALSMLYCPTIMLAKSALLVQLIHIFAPTRIGSVYRAIQILIWGNLAFYISTWFTIIFQCVPQDKIWNPERKGGRCINYSVAALAAGSVNVVSDFLILLLPLVAIWRLHMAPRRKVGVSTIFATGLLAFASSICRLAYTTRFFTSGDATYIDAQNGMWTLAEFTTIIVVTCFPVMPRFAELILGKTGHSRDTESNPSYQASRSISGTGGTPLSLRLPDGSDTWTKRGDAMAAPKNAYIPLGENGYKKAYKAYGAPEHGGIQRTVSIELTSNT